MACILHPMHMIPLTLPTVLFLLGAGVLSGALNAVAGGGSLISFPTMVALGIPSIIANASNASAQWPGSMSAAIGFKEQLPAVRDILKTLLIPTFFGGALGAWLLLATPEKAFGVLIPILIGFATLLLVFQPRLKAYREENHGHLSPQIGMILQFFISIYGGYFGAGMGILMLSVLGLMADRDIHQLNCLKSWLAVLINLLASIIFMFSGKVQWGPCLLIMAGSVVGGAVAARVSQKMAPDVIRLFVIILGCCMTVWFTFQAVR